jgi:uncharacterized protein YecE (DUF72 family)
MGAPRLYIGPSGWNYPQWRHGFYESVPQRQWLAHSASLFTGIEVNGTFYRLLRPEMFARWREEVPDDFAFAIKGHRWATHVHRLADTGSILTQRETTKPLGDKLAAVLWQLPSGFARNLPRLEAFAEGLGGWPEARHAIEFRHRSWFDDEVAACLARHRIAVCQSDAPRWPLWDCVTTDLVYVRLHGHSRLYRSNYGSRALATWSRRIRAWQRQGHTVHVYFDNTDEGRAPANARSLLNLLRRRRASS